MCKQTTKLRVHQGLYSVLSPAGRTRTPPQKAIWLWMMGAAASLGKAAKGRPASEPGPRNSPPSKPVAAPPHLPFATSRAPRAQKWRRGGALLRFFSAPSLGCAPPARTRLPSPPSSASPPHRVRHLAPPGQGTGSGRGSGPGWKRPRASAAGRGCCPQERRWRRVSGGRGGPLRPARPGRPSRAWRGGNPGVFSPQALETNRESGRWSAAQRLCLPSPG